MIIFINKYFYFYVVTRIEIPTFFKKGSILYILKH